MELPGEDDVMGWMEWIQDNMKMLRMLFGPNWLVWSNEHNSWWAPDRCGYTEDPARAGLYTFDEAMTICRQANKYVMNGKPKETMVKKNHMAGGINGLCERI